MTRLTLALSALLVSALEIGIVSYAVASWTTSATGSARGVAAATWPELETTTTTATTATATATTTTAASEPPTTADTPPGESEPQQPSSPLQDADPPLESKPKPPTEADTDDRACHKAIADNTAARTIHQQWIDNIKQNKVKDSTIELTGDIAWHQRWIRAYDNTLSILKDAC